MKSLSETHGARYVPGFGSSREIREDLRSGATIVAVTKGTGVRWQGDGLATKILLAFCRWTPWFRGKGRIFQWFAARFLGGSLCVHSDRGVRLNLDPTDYIGRTISFEGGFEPKSLALAAAIMSGGGVFVDAGCNFGLYTLLVGTLPGVQCIAIDGSFDALARLKDNLRRNPGVHATVVNCALALENGLQCFEVADTGNLGSTRIADNETEENPSRFWVAGVSVQHIFERLRPAEIELLKIDVEGSEMSVLKSLDFNGRYRPRNLIVECYKARFPQATEIYDFLIARGYEALSIEGRQIVALDNLPEENVWFRSTTRSAAGGNRTIAAGTAVRRARSAALFQDRRQRGLADR